MKWLIYGGIGLGALYLLAPATFAQLAHAVGFAMPTAPTGTTNTGTPAPVSNPQAAQAVGTVSMLNISGSKFGNSPTGAQNTVS